MLPMSMSRLYNTTDQHVCFPDPFGLPLIYPEIERPEGEASCFLRRYCGAEQGAYGLVHDRETNSEELAWKLSKYFVKLSRADVAAELPPIQRDAKVVDPIMKGLPRSFMGGGIEQAIARAASAPTTSPGPPTPSAPCPL